MVVFSMHPCVTYNERMTSTRVTINNQGRVSIPARIRHDLGIRPGSNLVCYEEDGRVVIEERMHLLHRIQRKATEARTGTGSVVDELIAERRGEAARERSEAGS